MSKHVILPFDRFISTPNESLLDELKTYHSKVLREPASAEQVQAWKTSAIVLRRALLGLIEKFPETAGYHVVFEYELPRERGRRPDAVLLFNKKVVVIEFKGWPKFEQAYVDQVAAYSRDLKHYHEHSHELEFKSVLVMISSKNLKEQQDEVIVISPEFLQNLLEDLWVEERAAKKEIDAVKWIKGEYMPLPSLVQAARMIFNHESLPTIRRAQSAGIPQALEQLMHLARTAKENKEHHLALITGVPGAGKTLVGISFVYNYYTQNEGSAEAILLSGNGPLVEVLQYALKSSVFVKDVHGFLKTHGGNSKKIPKEYVFIYDEAQRAWDKEKVLASTRGHDKSEPDDFLIIGSKKEWCLMIGLIGEGQEIHVGEESGIDQWNDAIKSTNIDWKVSCPEKLKKVFTNAKAINTTEALNLNTSLRSHVAADVQSWVNNVLEGNVDAAKDALRKINAQQFDVYITRNLLAAKQYVMDRYKEEQDKRFGLLASSKDKILPTYGIHNDFMSTRNVKKGPWYIDEKDSPFSCCQLTSVMTEFGCQGLELDFPIVAWGDDFIREGNQWRSNRITRGAQDSFQLRLNSYRVLLSRGRDGFIIYVPPCSVLDHVADFFASLEIAKL